MSATTMRTRGKRQNKFLRGITAPFRALNKFYMNTMFNCAASFDHAGTAVNCVMASQVSAQLPRNFSVNSSASSSRESIDREEEELRELIRVVSTKLNGSTKVDIKQVELRKPASMVANAAEMRSYSVGVGKIGRIDEDQPCDFKEGDANLGVYPRCRSYAVTRRSFVFSQA